MARKRYRLRQGDCLDALREIKDNALDAVVTDPPAGIGFMGKDWDKSRGGRDRWVAWLQEILAETLRVSKPGAHLLCWGIPRTCHWTAWAIESAGWEVRDCVAHHFGTGFPKSHNLKGEHEGWGTALKPATEMWWLARKLLEGTVAANVQKWGVGALNVGACVVPSGSDYADLSVVQGVNRDPSSFGVAVRRRVFIPAEGRWPPNLLLTHDFNCSEGSCVPDCPVAVMGGQSRSAGAQAPVKGTEPSRAVEPDAITGTRQRVPGKFHADDGTAARFFPQFRWEPDEVALQDRFLYQAKASRKERTMDGQVENKHPTVKPVALMQWLVRLVAPPGGIVCDPFMGSGTTGIACAHEGMRFFGIEQGEDSFETARRRIEMAYREI